jgi:hypothetical protein
LCLHLPSIDTFLVLVQPHFLFTPDGTVGNRGAEEELLSTDEELLSTEEELRIDTEEKLRISANC